MKIWLAKLWGNETFFKSYSAAKSDLMSDLAGKSVALVGNARSLEQGAFGDAIDSADFVIRINSAPIPSTRSHGSRTDWIAISTPISPELVTDRRPKRVLWMTRKRKRLNRRILSSAGFYLNRREDWRGLRDRLGGAPTTGLMVIDLLAQSEVAEVALYGFDFFQSKSLSGSREAHQVPHDFAREKVFVDGLLAQDARFTLNALPKPN